MGLRNAAGALDAIGETDEAAAIDTARFNGAPQGAEEPMDVAARWVLRGRILEALDRRHDAVAAYARALSADALCAEALQRITSMHVLANAAGA